MAEIGPPQQDALGKWVLFDGKQKRRFAEQADANIMRRRLNMANPVQTIEKLMLDNVATVQKLLDGLVTPVRKWDANDMSGILAVTPDGACPTGSVLTKEEWFALAACFESFALWLRTPLEGIGMTPEMIVSREYGEAVK
jgi:hypothetical protein